MKPSFAAALAAAAFATGICPVQAQDRTGIAPIANPRSKPEPPTVFGPEAPSSTPMAESGPLPTQLSLRQAIEQAEGRSPRLATARADVEAARGRLKQAGLRINPQLSVELENFAGSGVLSGFDTTETTVSVNQQLDLAGHRRARVSLGEAQLFAEQLRLDIVRADLARDVRRLFAQGVAARESLELAKGNADLARELSRIARELVDAGREPPLRGLRAQAALSRAMAGVSAAIADEQAARRSLAALLGADTPPERLVGDITLPVPDMIDPGQTLDVQLARAQRAIADAQLGQARAEGRVDPSIGIGVRHVRETGDVGLVAGFSMPLPVFNRNQGNIAASRSTIQGAEASLVAAQVDAKAQIGNARSSLEAAEARLAALQNSGLGESREALRLAELSYRAGKSSLIELLDAQRAYALTQSELIDARRARAEALAALARQAAGTEQGNF